MVHISTGMTTKDEVEKIVSFWEQGEGDALAHATRWRWWSIVQERRQTHAQR